MWFIDPYIYKHLRREVEFMHGLKDRFGSDYEETEDKPKAMLTMNGLILLRFVNKILGELTLEDMDAIKLLTVPDIRKVRNVLNRLALTKSFKNREFTFTAEGYEVVCKDCGIKVESK